MKRIILILILALPAAAQADGTGAHYFITLHNSAYNFKGGAELLTESHKVLRQMIKLADAQHVRLTLMFSAQYAVYISSDPGRLAELESWKRTGHEIGAYHTGPDTLGWDGYSDLTGEALARTRKTAGPAEKAQDHRKYFLALGRLAPEIKAGCMLGRADKEFLAAAPAYETCFSRENRAADEKNRPGFDGINESITVLEYQKKLLSCSHPSDRAGSAASKKAFLSMVSGVYGASFKSSPSEFGAFYAWLEFLKSVDPQGLRNRTVSGIVEGKLLTENKARISAEKPAAVKAAEKQAVPAQPERPKKEAPRIRPARGLHRQEDIIIFGPPRQGSRIENRAYCGDGICDAFERSHPGRCPRDCGK